MTFGAKLPWILRSPCPLFSNLLIWAGTQVLEPLFTYTQSPRTHSCPITLGKPKLDGGSPLKTEKPHFPHTEIKVYFSNPKADENNIYLLSYYF